MIDNSSQTVNLEVKNLGEFGEAVVVLPGVRTLAIPASAIGVLLSRTLPENIKSTTVKVRVNDGVWKTVLAGESGDTSIDITSKSRQIGVQLVTVENKPITYTIPLARSGVAIISSELSAAKDLNTKILVAVITLLLLLRGLLVIGKRRKGDKKIFGLRND